MKYDVRIFPNGRVVMLPETLVKEATEGDREILLICNSWSGGYAMAIGEKKRYDEEGNATFARYTYRVYNGATFEDDDIYKFSKIIFNEGEIILMETGDEAIDYSDKHFADWLTPNESIQDWAELDEGIEENLTEDQMLKRRFTIDEMATVRNLMGDIEGKVEAMIEKKILSEKAREYIIKEEEEND